MKQYFVYILASQTAGTLYIGVTSDLKKRIWDHRNKTIEGFTEKYNVDKLVYNEVYDDPENAIMREKRMKKMEPGVENQPDPGKKSRMVRFV